MGVDLLDFYRGELSPRRLLLLIKRLPASSRTVRKIQPDAVDPWEATAYVVADLIDYYAAAHFKNPKPYPRPAQLRKERESTDRRHAALVARAEARKGGDSWPVP